VRIIACEEKDEGGRMKDEEKREKGISPKISKAKFWGRSGGGKANPLSIHIVPSSKYQHLTLDCIVLGKTHRLFQRN
jgi:hypothetical protein